MDIASVWIKLSYKCKILAKKILCLSLNCRKHISIILSIDISHSKTHIAWSLIIKWGNKLSVSTGDEKIPRCQTEVAPSRHIQRSGGGDWHFRRYYTFMLDSVDHSVESFQFFLDWAFAFPSERLSSPDFQHNNLHQFIYILIKKSNRSKGQPFYSQY